MWFCSSTIDSGAKRQWCCWFDDTEENDEFCWSSRRFFLLLRTHTNQRKFHESYIRSSPRDIWILDARPLESYLFRKTSFPGIYRFLGDDEECTVVLSVL